MENPLKDLKNVTDPATTLNKIAVGWFDRFSKNRDAVYGFVSLVVILVLSYFIKDSYASQIIQKDTDYAVLKREKFVSDSMCQVRLDRSVSLGQERVDRVQASKDSVLILYGAKQALQR